MWRPACTRRSCREEELLANVDGVLNAIQVEGDLVGRVLFQGPGAGPQPTSSAIIANVIDAAQSMAAATRWPRARPLAPGGRAGRCL